MSANYNYTDTIIKLMSIESGKMYCPSCKTQLNDKDLNCPNCKKVVRLECPICKNITQKTICEKCGTVILNKCYKCGKLNKTTQKKCPQCGLDINASIGLKESTIEEFAALTIEITNFQDLKAAFKNNKLISQFKDNLFTHIQKNCQQKKLRVQRIDNTFIIRFCKDYTFKESCYNAIDFAIYIAQTVTSINQKLFEAKGITLNTQMAIQKRDIYSKPNEYKSGININVVYSSSRTSHLFNNIELIVDSYIYNETKEKLPYQSLSAIQIKNQMMMFFELILHKVIELKEEEKETETTIINLPKNLSYEPEENTDEQNLITFKSLNCSFINTRGENFISRLSEISTKNITNPIISVKTTTRNNILPLISDEIIQNIFTDYKIKFFSCTQNLKHSPYGLIKRMFLEYKDVTELDLLTNNLITEALTTDNDLTKLLRMKEETIQHPEDMRYNFYELFEKFIQNIPTKTLFVIKDFENSDETSIEILKYLIENDKLGSTGFLFTNSTDFPVHRKVYKLMTSPNYFEIEMKPSSNSMIVNDYAKKIKNIQNSFFIEKILENTKGSRFYFQQALNYLQDNNILKEKNQKYEITKDEMIVIPKDINELIQKRMMSLKNSDNLFEFFASIILLGEKLPQDILLQLEFKNFEKLLKQLEERKFIKLENNKLIIENYNIYKENIIKILTNEEKEKIALNLINKIYKNTTIPNVENAEIKELANQKKEAFRQWHKLSIISNQLGDFCAYFNNANKFLSLIDNIIDESTNNDVEKIKMDVYTEIATTLYKYYPEKTLNYLDKILNNLEKENDNKKIKEIANMLVQSCIVSGNYTNALEYIGKIIARTPQSSFNPKDKEFNISYFLLNLVTLEIYFNLGKLNECIELGDELFKYINFDNLESEEYWEPKLSKKGFIDALADGMYFVNTAKIIQLKPTRINDLKFLTENPKYRYSCFELLELLNNLLQGEDISEKLTEILNKGINDKHSLTLFPLLQGLQCLQYQNWEMFGNYIYNAKLKARAFEQHQINYFCDLMIGYAYLKLNNNKKAKEIFYSVLDITSEKGIKNLVTLSWYFIAMAEFTDNKKAISLDMLNKALIRMEKETNISPIFLLLYKKLFVQCTMEENIETQIEEIIFPIEQCYNIALNNKILAMLPQVADILINVYTQIINTNNAEEIKIEYQTKIEKIKQTITLIFQTENKN